LRRAGIVFIRDFRELSKTGAFIALILIFMTITIAAAVILNVVLGRQEWLKTMAAEYILELIMGLIFYFLPLFILVSFIWAFANFPIVKEKVNGNIASLMVTPLTPGEILMGKSLSIFLPGFAISIISTLIVLLSVNFVTIRPVTGDFFLPAPMLVTNFVINPLLFFGLLIFTVLFSLANNPDVAIAPSFVVGFGLMTGIPIGVATGAINLTSWSFSLWYLAGAAVIWIVVLALSRLLTKENIILSSKGE
jgi:ABC-type transport system involved in multi-copper enzyme maturation permease subunit